MDILFYGRTKPDPKYWAFSNFYPAPFKDSTETVWPTTEHYFQAMKFLPNEEMIIGFEFHIAKKRKLREWIRIQPTPKDAAIQGRRRDLPIRKDWDKVKDNYMLEAIRYKFTQHEDLKELLLSTGDANIIEASFIDSYWGWGSDKKGKNILGKLLVILREELRNEN